MSCVAYPNRQKKLSLTRNDLVEVCRGESALLGRLFNFYPSVSRRTWSALKSPTVSRIIRIRIRIMTMITL